MRHHRFPAVVAAGATFVVLSACAQAGGEPLNTRLLGPEVTLGQGTITTFAELAADGSPSAIGIVLSSDALDAFPPGPTDEHRCFDLDGDGALAPATECIPTHERVIPLPTEVSRRADVPFKWVLLNWNSMGHAPPEIYGLPHFDIHYYIDSIENTFALEMGPCGPEFLRCDQFERAVRPVPANYVPADFQNVQAAAPAMGNHLIDLGSHEFHGSVFDRTWIYGTYDGRVTFWEEMVTVAYLRSRPETCHDIKTPPAVEMAGYYPTRSCYRYDPASGEQTVAMEGFVHREASPPATAEE